MKSNQAGKKNINVSETEIIKELSEKITELQYTNQAYEKKMEELIGGQPNNSSPITQMFGQG